MLKATLILLAMLVAASALVVWALYGLGVITVTPIPPPSP